MNRLLDWAARGLLPPAQLDTLGLAIGVLPDRSAWRHFLDRALLLAGVLLLASGLIFFIAANWALLGAFAKFALAQALVLLGIAAYWRYGDQRMGRAGLGFSVLALGALLALYGQTYQTGADAWQLFATWALLALPWVWLGNSALLWLGWLLLVDLGLLRYLSFRANLWHFLSSVEVFGWTMFLVHAAALVAAEVCGARGWAPGRSRVARNLLYLCALASITSLCLLALLDADLELEGLAWLGYGLTMVATWFAYRVRSVDLLALAAASLSLIVVLVCALANAVGLDNFYNPLLWLLFAVLLMVLTSGAGRWLLRVAREPRRQLS